jgi:hypothetical protein
MEHITFFDFFGSSSVVVIDSSTIFVGTLILWLMIILSIWKISSAKPNNILSENTKEEVLEDISDVEENKVIEEVKEVEENKVQTLEHLLKITTFMPHKVKNSYNKVGYNTVWDFKKIVRH